MVSTRVFGNGIESTLMRSEPTLPARPSGLTDTPSLTFLTAIQPLDPQEVRERLSDTHKRLVPLREHRYRRLSSVLNTAQQKGRTVRDVIVDLSREAGTSIEAALLLRDLWEVLRIIEHRMGETRSLISHTLLRVVDALERHPFGGEEVLF